VGCIHYGAIQLQGQFHHGIGFVDIVGREEPMTICPKGLLDGGQNAPIFSATARHIQESEQDEVRRNADEIVEVTSDALSAIESGDFCLGEQWNFHRSGQRFRWSFLF
jgi:hypothetical protein